MALRDEYRALATEIFDEFDDVVRSATLTRPTRPRINATGTQTDAAATYATRCVFTEGVRIDPVTGLVSAHEASALVPAAELAIDPAAHDRLTIDGRTFAVTEAGVSIDAARALWTLNLQRLAL